MKNNYLFKKLVESQNIPSANKAAQPTPHNIRGQIIQSSSSQPKPNHSQSQPKPTNTTQK